jgi:hypothetical protein
VDFPKPLNWYARGSARGEAPAPANTAPPAVWIEWFQKVNTHTNPSTHCCDSYYRTIRWRFCGEVDFWKSCNWYARGSAGREASARANVVSPAVLIKWFLKVNPPTKSSTFSSCKEYKRTSWRFCGRGWPFKTLSLVRARKRERRSTSARANAAPPAVLIKWFQKVNNPTQSSTYALHEYYHRRSWRFCWVVDFPKPFNWYAWGSARRNATARANAAPPAVFISLTFVLQKSIPTQSSTCSLYWQ